MPENKVHIVCFDIPYPPTYGGAIDVFYKIKALSQLGTGIHLHTFLYHRDPSKKLEKYCQKVSYYERHVSQSLMLNKLPYIIISRKNNQLLQNLLQEDSPILMEGLHTTSLLENAAIRARKNVVRTHNIEHDYYKGLADVEKNMFKKIYFSQESKKLKKWEPVLASAGAVAAISPEDTRHFATINPNSFYLPAFHPFEEVKIAPGLGNFALYHGNLSVAENATAAIKLIEKVFSKTSFSFIIAGNNPGRELKEAVAAYPHIRLVSNPDEETMNNLISQAQINILITKQPTGIKLKLLYSLFRGRHCITNDKMVENTGLESLCHICTSVDDIKAQIISLAAREITDDEREQRRKILERWNNLKNAENLLKYLR